MEVTLYRAGGSGSSGCLVPIFALVLLISACAAFDPGAADNLAEARGRGAGIAVLAAQLKWGGVNFGFLGIAFFAAFMIYRSMRTDSGDILVLADSSGLRLNEGGPGPDFVWREIAEVVLDRQPDTLTLLIKLRNGDETAVGNIDRDEDVRQAFLQLAAARLSLTPPF